MRDYTQIIMTSWSKWCHYVNMSSNCQKQLNYVVLQSIMSIWEFSPWKIEFTGPNQILESLTGLLVIVRTVGFKIWMETGSYSTKGDVSMGYLLWNGGIPWERLKNKKTLVYKMISFFTNICQICMQFFLLNSCLETMATYLL